MVAQEGTVVLVEDYGVVVQRADSEPAVGGTSAQAVSEPAQLLLATEAMVMLGQMAFGHGGVEAGNHRLELRHLE